jgi:hypothetical protein
MMRSIWLAVFLCACSPATPGPKPTPVKGATCDDACVNLRRLDCPLGKTTPKGATCEQVCTNAKANAIIYDTACFAGAMSCEAAKGCE